MTDPCVLLYRALCRDAEAFKEDEHPRQEDGKFGAKGGSGASTQTRGHAIKPLERPMSFPKKSAFVEKELGVDAKTAEKYVRASSFYSGAGYTAVRSGKAAKSAAALEAYVKAAPKWDGNGPVYRGISLSDDEFKSLAVGSTIGMNGLSSWSSDKGVAANYAARAGSSAKLVGRSNTQRVLLKMDKADTGTSLAHFSKYPTEEEVLVSGETHFEVGSISQKRVKDQNGKMRTLQVVHVKEVPGGE